MPLRQIGFMIRSFGLNINYLQPNTDQKNRHQQHGNGEFLQLVHKGKPAFLHNHIYTVSHLITHMYISIYHEIAPN